MNSFAIILQVSAREENQVGITCYRKICEVEGGLLWDISDVRVFFCQVDFFNAAVKTFKWSHSEYINTFHILNPEIQDVIVVIVTYIQL